VVTGDSESTFVAEINMFDEKPAARIGKLNYAVCECSNC
jgi:hypothetical protein